MVANKDQLEKERLAARNFGHQRNVCYENPLEAEAQVQQYADPQDRFNRDVVGEERARKEEKLMSYDAKLMHKAEQADMREGQRWQTMEEQFLSEQQRLQSLQHRPAARTNKNSLPVNPLNLEYHPSEEVTAGTRCPRPRPPAPAQATPLPAKYPIPTRYPPQGQVMKYMDDCTKRRAAQRSERLYNKMHSVEFDIITGNPKQEHQRVRIPPQPSAPWATDE